MTEDRHAELKAEFELLVQQEVDRMQFQFRQDLKRMIKWGLLFAVLTPFLFWAARCWEVWFLAQMSLKP